MDTTAKLLNSDNEGTAYPFWLIIDPRQNFETGNAGLHNIASMVHGVFFSRKDAQDFLDATRYNFSKNAKVYCHSGHASKDWRDLSKKEL
jgi:hypothetical protein